MSQGSAKGFLIDTDDTLSGNSDLVASSQKAVKTYIGNIADNKINSNTPIVGATKTKVTYDNNGLVTSGADATTSDIADSTDKRYVTDAEKTKLGHISITQAVDLDTLENDTATNNAKVSNATHTGDATGATALTVVKIQGKDFPTLSVSDDQKYPKYDNATNAFIMTTIAGGGDMLKSDNLSGLTNYATARTNLGLGNVDNTSDLNKPISTATQTALDGKVNDTGNETIAGDKTFSGELIMSGDILTIKDFTTTGSYLSLEDATNTERAGLYYDSTGGTLVSLYTNGTELWLESSTGIVINTPSLDLATSSKVTPLDADTVYIKDTASSNEVRQTTWANVKAFLKTYFDTLYQVAGTIVGISSTKAQFDTACSDGNFLYVGDVTQYTDELAQDAVGAMVDTTLTYTDGTPLLSRSALTGAITASAGSNTTALGSFTKAQLDTAVSDGVPLFVGDQATLSSTQAFCTAETTLSAVTYADITGASISLVAGTWIIFATINGASQTTTVAVMMTAITDSANTVIAESSQHLVAGTATVRTWGSTSLSAIVTPGVTTTYKLRGARGTTTQTGNWIASDGNGVNTANNVSNNSDKGTSIRAIRIA
jgi:hypothetical protein